MKSASQYRLETWLQTKRRTRRSLANELGVSGAYITMLLAGERTPSLQVAKRLQEVTGIPATEFIAAPLAKRKSA